MPAKESLMILIIVIIISIIWNVQAICRGSSSYGYRGTIEQCYCECNQAFQAGFNATTCTWFPYGQFSSGGCNYCDNKRRKRESLLIRKGLTVFAVEKRDNTDKRRTVVQKSSGPFAVQKCSCIGCDNFSGPYTRTQQECEAYCKSIANSFINGQITFSYLPDGQFSKGSCKCCGYKDPCYSF